MQEEFENCVTNDSEFLYSMASIFNSLHVAFLIAENLENIVSIGPIREEGKYHYNVSAGHSDVGFKGEHMASVLTYSGGSDILQRINLDLIRMNIPYQLKVQNAVSGQFIRTFRDVYLERELERPKKEDYKTDEDYPKEPREDSEYFINSSVRSL